MIADALEVRDQMGRQHDRELAFGDLAHQRLEELSPRQGIEACQRLVEQEQPGTLREGEREPYLGALAPRKGADALSGVDTGSFDAGRGEIVVPARVRPPAELEHVSDRERSVQRNVLRHETDISEETDVSSRRSTEHTHGPDRGPEQAGCEVKQRRLAGSVRSD